ncbi:thioredoxin family protein [Amycolatopsis alkalitolerans]|uniref:Thioredoxin family protein n=1 Tax=Amycolatopsis alkalitolerans TaxID=2547244 RepID=A0A5C4M2D9_9PSEU|nr:thioredoxin family protein [Amycolatopsis alkalitolerans]TNC25812.1 thioredoxin family protein [Amycolatopsis alkalitolerans]
MAPVTVTTEGFAAFGTSADILFIEFGDSCEPVTAEFARASERYPELRFGTVDVTAEPGLGRAFGIAAVPALMIVRDGIVLYAREGATAGPLLEELIAKVRTVDMETVRRRLASDPALAGKGVA